MQNVREILESIPFSSIESVVYSHMEWSKVNKRVSGNPQFSTEPGTLNVIAVDCDTNGNPNDDEFEFNLGRYKDFVLLVKNKPDGTFRRSVVQVTCDPETDKYLRGQMMPGSYDAYNVGIHGLSSGLTSVTIPGKGTFKRWGLRQDRNKIYVGRSGGKGKPIKYEWAMGYMNLHNPGASAGCIVTATNLIWLEDVLPFLYDIEKKEYGCTNHDKITLHVMNHVQLGGYLGTEIIREELADAVNPVEGDSSGAGKGASKEKIGENK